MNQLRTRRLCYCALFAALTGVCAQLSIAIGPVPISMASLIVKNRIDSFDQLHAHQRMCRELISVLCDERIGLRGRQSPEAEARLAVIREQLKTLRREVRTCDEIEEDSILLEEKRRALRSIPTERPQKRTRTQREKT